MRIAIIIVAFSSLLFGSGCLSETHPVGVSRSQEINSDHVLNAPPNEAKSLEDGAGVFVIRDSGMMGFAASLKFFIDGTPVALLDPYERYVAYIPEGEHIFGVLPQPKFGAEVHETTVILRKGKMYHFRASVDFGGAKIQPTAFVQ